MELGYKKHSGFTLVALLVAMVIILIVFGIVYFNSGKEVKNSMEIKTYADELNEARQVIDAANERTRQQEAEIEREY
jgi:type II secretory pathway pseudopilin PulG